MPYGFQLTKEKANLSLEYTPRVYHHTLKDVDTVSAVFDGSTIANSIPLDVDEVSDEVNPENVDLSSAEEKAFLHNQNMVFVTAHLGSSAPVDVTVYGGLPQTNGIFPANWTKAFDITLPLGSGSVTLEVQIKKKGDDSEPWVRTKSLANTSGETRTSGTFTFRAGNWAIV